MKPTKYNKAIKTLSIYTLLSTFNNIFIIVYLSNNLEDYDINIISYILFAGSVISFSLTIILIILIVRGIDK